LARIVNDVRKEQKLEFTDRIEIGLVTDSAELRAAIEQFCEYIMGESLAIKLDFGPIAGGEPVDLTIGDYKAMIYIRTTK
jgi:isoleucyl-tRNA synthetase